ncbi:MAG: hypothetical protein ACOH5I_22465 [Oligoflexus sp.]
MSISTGPEVVELPLLPNNRTICDLRPGLIVSVLMVVNCEVGATCNKNPSVSSNPAGNGEPSSAYWKDMVTSGKQNKGAEKFLGLLCCL